MKKEREPHYGFPFGKPREELVEGLQGAIEATKRSIAEHKANSWDTSELEAHLKSLEQRLEVARKK
ncbi:MAG: hypothetical protein HY505_02170 [Candidatus Yanofskybacteria bacterium]|nr:hypothetical protein [Candidatus Yanofskybacteria bacterium]